MPIYAVERKITIGNYIAYGQLGPDLCTLEQSASAPICLFSDPTTTVINMLLASKLDKAPVTSDPTLASYKGRIGRGIPNPTFGTKYINYLDHVFGYFGIRFSEKHDHINICRETGRPLLIQDYPKKHSAHKELIMAKPSIILDSDGILLMKEEINKPPISLILRYHPKSGMRGRKIFRDRILSK